MKLAIFENEFQSVKGAFDSANLLNFDNLFTYDVYVSTQLFSMEWTMNYDIFIVDMDLSTKSELDGFGLIKKFTLKDELLLNKIIVLTGNNKIREVLKERNIDIKEKRILVKPISYKEITDSINDVI